MQFDQKGYTVVRSALNKTISTFVYDYFMMKRMVFSTLLSTGYVSKTSQLWGTFDDAQVPDTYSHYGDICMEMLLTKLQEKMEAETELELVPTYSYARIYKKGDILKKHKDRPSCAVSCTLNLGGPQTWSIWITDKDGMENEVILEQGDMLVYKGDKLEHWREPFQGDHCVQVFLHYNDTKSEYKNAYDGRLHLGLPKGITNG
tara:strand:- start:2240 stop:2848 length:609 start_codon:yes stop_codon:yes gene_type:complete